MPSREFPPVTAEENSPQLPPRAARRRKNVRWGVPEKTSPEAAAEIPKFTQSAVCGGRGGGMKRWASCKHAEESN